MVAAILMVIDHIGYIFFPDMLIWRIVGRLSLPLFAYGIAKGYGYSHEKGTEERYLKKMLILAICSQVPYYLMAGEGINIGFTWVCSLLLMMILSRTEISRLRVVLECLMVLCVAYLLDVDYGIYGVLMPFAVHSKYKYHKMFLHTVLLWAVYVAMNGIGGLIQVFACLSVPLLVILEPLNGKIRLPKRFFYVFYPAHIVILLAINYIM